LQTHQNMALSKETLAYIENAKGQHITVDRPSWTDYFISMAFLASTRSSDSQTNHGCVITDSNNRVLGLGYNGFPAGMPDDILPNTRPNKYKWMVHAERNALANCSLRPEKGTAYITGPPCLDCAKALYQEGVRHFVCVDGHGTHLEDNDDKCVLEILIESANITVDWVDASSIGSVFKKLVNIF